MNYFFIGSDKTSPYETKITCSYQLIVRTSNHVLYVSNVSRVARPNIFYIYSRNEKKSGL